MLPVDYCCTPLSFEAVAPNCLFIARSASARMTRCCHCEESQGATKLVRTNRSGFHPGVEKRASLALRAWSGLAAHAGRPGPADQVIGRRHDARSLPSERPPLRAGSLICAQICPSVLPSHAISRGARCQTGIARHAAGVEIRLLMTDRTTHCRKPEAVFAALDRRLVQAAEIALARAIAGGMAVHAARMGQHFADFGEQGRRARRGVADRGKAFGVARARMHYRQPPRPESTLISRAAIATTITVATGDRQPGLECHDRRFTVDCLRTSTVIGLRSDKVALRIGQDHVAHRLVIFDVAGAAAEMAVERLARWSSRDRRAPRASSPDVRAAPELR